MALVLCHQCYSWVEPIAEQCPHCDFPLDARVPDPSVGELRSVIGQLVSCIGDVRFVRTSLPAQGMLYETTNGLFFVPHRLEQVKLVHESNHRSSFRAMLAASIRAPLTRLGRPSPPAGSRMEVAVDRPHRLSPEDSDRLPNLLMQNPGVFFLAKRAIRRIRYSLWGWTISRPNGLVLRFKPIGDRNGFHERMSALSATLREAVCP